VSDFRLDKFEVTVARFRQFLDHYPAGAPDGTGANPHLPGSGWQSSWNVELAGNPGEPLPRACSDAAERGTFTSLPGGNENQPMNCVTWYEAFLFCLWDGGGRLPTSAEWNYAASGGSEQRVYPWSAPPSAAILDPLHANYACDGGCAGAPVSVGRTSPEGNGRWGQADLAGNVREWILDVFAFSPMVPCIDCAQLAGGPQRGHRGGGFKDANPFMLVVSYTFGLPAAKEANLGFRCARTP
jgi:sulfatase modifying factor 1